MTVGMERNFNLESYESEFCTGVCNKAQQAIMGLLCPEIVCCLFDQDGNYVKTIKQAWKKAAPRKGEDGPYNIYDKAFVQAITQQLEDWQQELSFIESPISIKKFWDDDNAVGITDSPAEDAEDDDDDDIEDSAEDDAQEDEEEDDEGLDEWDEGSRFVFNWGKEYWVSGSGIVEST